MYNNVHSLALTTAYNVYKRASNGKETEADAPTVRMMMNYKVDEAMEN